MIRRKVTDLLRVAEKRPAFSPAQAVPAVLADSELQTQPDFGAVLNRVGKTGKRFHVAMTALSPAKDYSSAANGVLLTTKQVCRLFDVTTMTIYHWTHKTGLPRQQLVGGKNPPVRFDEGAVLAWAKDRGRPVVHTDYLDWQ